MKPTVQLFIPTPCHEDWHKMQPGSQGRFCNACSKQVIDFSAMSDQQVLQYFSAAQGNVCGRFNSHQLMRDLAHATQPSRKSKWVAALLPLLALFSKAEAQKTMGKPAIGQYQSDRQLTGDTVIIATKQTIKASISGWVIDSSGAPIAYSSITIAGTKYGCVADSAGYYHLSFDAPGREVTISYAAVGYVMRSRQLLLSESRTAIANMELLATTTLDEVLVVGEIIPSRRSIKLKRDTIAASLCKVVKGNTCKLYPNPVTAGGTTTLTVSAWEHFTVEVYTTGGAPVYNQEYTNSKKMPIQIPVAGNWHTGMYYVRVVEIGSGKNYTTKLLVQ
ncbi:carboxypeptidase-like regulatory domain-containing protein [Deminuibacter soli]|uniref:T9SS C-terminal target domain-containing protein n=1 Tax=Deminuibacter soli TaxID=2291815 RepID=A0A3E1NL01_9BACT|nr:carboxypeptidase-like regulatory domain-containing protein [Deminuibacter soli]RFM28606.1 T9SS C-terminal target domain-containing protein [Deminuibacter soli]